MCGFACTHAYEIIYVGRAQNSVSVYCHLAKMLFKAALAALGASMASAGNCAPLSPQSNLTIWPCAGADPSLFVWSYAPRGNSPYGPRFLQLKSNPSMCMAEVGISPLSNTANVGVAPCDATNPSTGWYIGVDGAVYSAQDGMVLDVYDQLTTPGTRVDTYNPNGQLNQKWMWNATAGLLVSAQSGFCAGLC